jgi:hypothetical protein
MTPAGFPHSDIPGSQLGCQLPRAYRRLQRPSSALDAKASTMCPSQLATTNTTPHPTVSRPLGTARRRRRHATKETRTTTTHLDLPRRDVKNRTGSPVVMRRYKIHQPTHPTPHTESVHRISTQNQYGVRVRVSRRCSRPLSTSQPTTPHHPPPGTPRWRCGRARNTPPGAGEVSEPQQCVPTPSPR